MNTDLEPSAESRIHCLGELGRGETTIVELIHDRDREATFARKRWPRTSAELRFRLKQQFRRAQAIEHRNLVRLYELEVDANETSLTMEAVSGSDVVAHMQALAQAGCDDTRYIAVALDVLRQLTEALIALHAGGLVHRDVKPRNVLIEPSGRVVLLDAGFAWPPQQHFDPQRDRVLAATLPYLAPECLRGALPSEEADWYSFGALATELLTGRAPFSGSLDAVLRAKDAPFSSLSDACPAVPELLDEMLCALLIRDASARPTAIEVQEVLAELAADYPLPEPLAADGGGDAAVKPDATAGTDDSELLETLAAETEPLPSIAAPSVSMVVGPSGAAATLALDVELARSVTVPALELTTDDTANPTPCADPTDTPAPLTAAPLEALANDAAVSLAMNEPEAFEADAPFGLAPSPLMAADSLELALEPTPAVEPMLDELAPTEAPHGSAEPDVAPVSQAQTLEDARAQRSTPPEPVAPGDAALSQAQTLADARAQRSAPLEPNAALHALNDSARETEAEQFALETLTSLDLAPAPPPPADPAADALGLDLAAELRDALVSRRIFDAPETDIPSVTSTHSTWTEQRPHAPANTIDSTLSAPDADVLETLERVFDASADSTPTPDKALDAAIAALIDPSTPEPPPAADGGKVHPRSVDAADPWLQQALDAEVAGRTATVPAREAWIELAFEQARANSAEALPKVSAPPLSVNEDPTGRFAVPDAWLEVALDPAEPLARVDSESSREPWATLTLEPLDTLPALTTEDGEPDAGRDSWRALEPHELPEPLRDPDFPALPLYDEDDDPALELAEARPNAIGLLAALQLTAANDIPPAGAPVLEVVAPPAEASPAEPAKHTPRRSPTADLRIERLEQRLRDRSPQLVLLRGDAGSGKTELLEELLQRVKAQTPPRAIIACTVAPTTGAVFEAMRALMQGLIPIAERCSFTLPNDRATALRAIFPELRPRLPEAPDASPVALEPQRRWIDAVLGFRAFFRQLTAEQPLLIAIDDAHLLDLDSAHLLRALLAVAPLPNATWLFTQRADGELPPPLMAAIAPGHGEARLPVAIHDMDPLRSSRLSLPAIAPDEPAEAEDAAALFGAAEAAADALALQRAAELHTRALRAASAPTLSQLEAAATAFSRAGRLREASETWLSAARQTRDPLEAQSCELNAGAALLRVGDEDRGREQLQSVLKICDLTWPRAPLLTSTLERARMLLQSHRPRIPVHDAALRRRRFDALWHSAKELVLVAPVTGDALSVRALREALMLGDASRLAWALGYEAVSAANIGGSFMRRRASTLVSEMRALTQQSGTPFDTAYARSVEAAVAFLSGDWHDAEQLLRTALVGFAHAPEPTAHEEHVVGTFLVNALEAQGKLEALTELLPELQLMAAETGHCTAHALYALAEAGLPALARDRALEAIASADAVLAELGGEGFSSLHFQHFVATASARLYAGHYAQAFQQVEQTWQRVRHTYLPQLDAVSVMLHQLRARAALALAKQSSVHEAERLVKHATKLANELAGSSLPHALALRHVIDANLALLRGRTAQADAHCWQASQCFEGAGMTLMSEVARHARAALAETAEAQADAARCRAYFARIGIARPSAFTGAWFPVFGN